MKREPELMPVGKTRRSHPSAPAPAAAPQAPTYRTPAGRTRKMLYLSTPAAQALDELAEALWRAGAATKADAYEAILRCGTDNPAAAYKLLGIKHG